MQNLGLPDGRVQLLGGSGPLLDVPGVFAANFPFPVLGSAGCFLLVNEPSPAVPKNFIPPSSLYEAQPEVSDP